MPETNLERMIALMSPVLEDGTYVFVPLDGVGPGGLRLFATVCEPEGRSAVVSRDDADRLGLEYDFVAAWITLRVESSLSAVGLTAAVSACLAERGISCNVIAGLRHDHLLVPADRAPEAMEALAGLSRGSRPG